MPLFKYIKQIHLWPLTKLQHATFSQKKLWMSSWLAAFGFAGGESATRMLDEGHFCKWPIKGLLQSSTRMKSLILSEKLKRACADTKVIEEPLVTTPWPGKVPCTKLLLKKSQTTNFNNVKYESLNHLARDCLQHNNGRNWSKTEHLAKSCPGNRETKNKCQPLVPPPDKQHGATYNQ